MQPTPSAAKQNFNQLALPLSTTSIAKILWGIFDVCIGIDIGDAP